DIRLNPKVKHTIEVVIDRLVLDPENRLRLAESVELALKKSKGLVVVLLGNSEKLLSEHSACVDCGISYPEIEPRIFSFNAPQGACPKCAGLGMLYAREEPDEEAVGEICPKCLGTRLRPESQFIRVGDLSIVELTRKSI
ncbi:MAG: hypothetical protein WCK42_09095, partial [Myxococcaceae bacterium]